MLQVPVSLGLAICAFANLHFTYWMLTLENPLSHPMTDLATKRAKIEYGTASVERDEILVYGAFKAQLLLHNDEFIDGIRVHFEAKHANLMAEGRRRDPHLYAVLKPTRSENIVRICSIFRALTTTEQAKIIATGLAVKPCSKRP